MNLEVLLVLAVATFTAYANGANDVSKGIATLVGSGVSDYRTATRWGTAWTAIGAMAGALFAGAMVKTFGSGLLAAGTTPTFAASLATIVGAAAWVLVATRTGLPVSTTHALVGSLAGVATVAYGLEGVEWAILAGKVLLPLLISPLVALALTTALVRAGRALFGDRSDENDCLCAHVEPVEPVLSAATQGAVLSRSLALGPEAGQLKLTTGTAESCEIARPAAARLTLDHLHWLTSGATSFARGMNDTPKIVGLALVALALGSGPSVRPAIPFAFVITGMLIGSLVGGRRVTRVLAEEVTRMDSRQGFAANLVTAGLVAAGAVGGVPMSTTHVSSSGIMGAGIAQRDRALNCKTVREMLLAWVVTLPAAALLGIVMFGLARAF